MDRSENNEVQMQNLLAAVTDAMLAEEDADIDAIIARYNVPRGRVEDMLKVIRRLHVVLVGQQPSEKFARRLKQDLFGQDPTMVNRLRYLPARVQIAAGVTVVAGFMLIARRRLIGDAAEDSAEIPALQQQ